MEPRVVADATTHVDVLPTLLHLLAGRNVPLKTTTGRDVLSNDPPPTFQLIGADSLAARFELLMSHDGRRILFTFPRTHFEAIVRGEVSATGEIDPYSLPPASEASEWAAEAGKLFTRMAGME